MTSKYVGWYDAAGQSEPTFDPGPTTPCVVCHKSLTPDNVRTISVMWQQERTQSLFYRMHRTCSETLTDTERELYDGAVLDHAPYSLS